MTIFLINNKIVKKDKCRRRNQWKDEELKKKTERQRKKR
jgi:hypothetical protein